MRVPIYNQAGRLRGSFVYLLLIRMDEKIWVKVGMSDNPMGRLESLSTGCPREPEVLATAELPNRRMARVAEQHLHIALKEWRANGEWFEFTADDKPRFNAIVRGVLDRHSGPSWRVELTKIWLPELRKQNRQIQSMHWKRRHSGSLARQDFMRHSAS